MHFDTKDLTKEDAAILKTYIGDLRRQADLSIEPEGLPYIYRWYLVPRNKIGNVYLHVQVSSDPERPLHDHPWDNQSVILAGGYLEQIQLRPPSGPVLEHRRLPGQVIHREAGVPHRVILPEGTPYSISLFTTGKRKRDWGFWTPQGWVNEKTLIKTTPDGRSVFRNDKKG